MPGAFSTRTASSLRDGARDEPLKLSPRAADLEPMLRFAALLSALGFAISLAALLGKAAAGTPRS